MLSFAEISRKTDKVLKIIDNLKKDTINDIFDEYSVFEQIKKILEKKEIAIGDTLIDKIAIRVIDKKDIDYDKYSLVIELEILESLIKNKVVRKEKQEKIDHSFLTFEKLKEKIENIGNDKRSLYNFLDEYLVMILKKKMIMLSDFNRRQLLLRLCDRKSIKSEKYELSKSDFDRIRI